MGIQLNTDEIAMVNETWLKLMKTPKESGVLLFINLFKAYPDYKNLFIKLERISMEDLASSRQMKAHGVTHLRFSSRAFATSGFPHHVSLDGPLVYSHFSSVDLTQNLWIVFLDTCGGVLGDSFSEAEAAAWKKMFAIMEKYIFKGLQQDD
ncbi:globin-1-like [Gordionus sp. m RMFG-2023]|uniref:globin-1-like n=1 Tax=Gordionus sp. m RMFG-2023 TaxID=3053472 RepID=UPI0031FBDEDD